MESKSISSIFFFSLYELKFPKSLYYELGNNKGWKKHEIIDVEDHVI